MVKVFDGEGIILGRLASRVAKEILLGETVNVVNCEKVVISGSKWNTYKREAHKRNRGGHPLTRAKLPRLPDRFVRRAIRGMLPWKLPRGKDAFKKVMCYRGIPEEFEKTELIKVDNKAHSNKLPIQKSVTIGEVCTQIGGK